MEISEYIRNSYRLVENLPLGGLDDYYLEIKNILFNGIPDFLRSNGAFLLVNPDYHLHVIYAFDKTSSVVYSTEPATVIHNRYLGQTLNVMNKIFFYAKDGASIFSYQYRLLQEQFYADGLDEFAIVLNVFRKHYSLDDAFKPFMAHMPPLPHSFPQEVYILAHELMHLSFYQNLLDRDNHISVVKNMARETAEWFEKGCNKNDLSLVSDIVDTEWPEEAKSFIAKAYREIVNDDHYCEEIACDVLAFNFVLKALADRFSRKLIEESVYLLHRHLRILERVKICARGKQSDCEEANHLKLAKDTLRRQIAHAISDSNRNKDVIEFRRNIAKRDKQCNQYHDLIDNVAISSLTGINGICNIAETFFFNLNDLTYKIENPFQDRDINDGANK